MNNFASSSIILFKLLTMTASSNEVNLVPEYALGATEERCIFTNSKLTWKCETLFLGELVEVCKVKPLPRDFSKLVSLAEEYGMNQVNEWEDTGSGSAEEGCIWYQGKPRKGFFLNPNTGYGIFFLKGRGGFQRKESGEPILKGMPTEEEAVKLGREWLAKLGISEDRLCSDPERPGQPEVIIRKFSETSWNEALQKATTKITAFDLTFPQKIGKFPAFWNGSGGRVSMKIEDGGVYVQTKWCLRGWEPLGKYPVLSKEEVEAALRDGFAWVYASQERSRKVATAKEIEIVECEISAFHGRDSEPQRHFPLILCLRVQPAGQPEDVVTVSMPALRQHRDKYPLVEGQAERKPMNNESDSDPSANDPSKAPD